MKSNLSFPSQLDFSSDLLQKVNRCIEENLIYTLWYGPVWGSQQFRVLWMYTSNKLELERIFSTSYSTSLFSKHQVLIIVLDAKDMSFHDQIGNTLFKTSLTKDRLIYQQRDFSLQPRLYKPIKEFKTQYLDKHALLAGYCHDFVASKISGSNLAYMKSLAYSFEVLELLLLGVKNTCDSFTDRLLLLERILPQMKTLFVKGKNRSYYMLDYLDQDDTWNDALEKVQQNLLEIVLDVLEDIDLETTLLTSKQKSKKKTKPSFKYKEKLLPLLETNLVEEIYQFHETLYCKEGRQIRQCYLVVITTKKATKEFQEISRAIATKDAEIHFTMLSHTRLYIQEHADLFAAFFKPILKPKNCLYSSGYYPQIHWQKKYWTSEQDYPALWRKNLEKSDKMIQHDLQQQTNEMFISTYQLHQCLVVKLQLYILHHLAYLPNTSHLDTLLQLALYAQNKEATTLNSLYNQLGPLLFVYTSQKREEKKYNLVLDPPTIQRLKQFFSTIEVLKA
ncbi:MULTISPECIES: hypothetical protein [unclassified Myroides]|uniref:hypothetical protein n=1 Tax=unclassified Myroides TaxID=2642485 RepID=UPI003D2F7B87